MQYFESVTKTKVKDCFVDLRGILTFVVEQGQIIKAVGRNASNVKKLETKLNKKIRIVEFRSEIENLVKNLMHPNKSTSIVFEDGIVSVTPADLKSRGYMIGKSAIMLKTNFEILKRFYPDLKELKILNVAEAATSESNVQDIEDELEEEFRDIN